MKTTPVEVRQYFEVTVDASKFTPEWLAEFRSYMYPFQTIGEHIEHLAQLYARGLVDDDSFIEGYGQAKDMGISFSNVDIETEIQ